MFSSTRAKKFLDGSGTHSVFILLMLINTVFFAIAAIITLCTRKRHTPCMVNGNPDIIGLGTRVAVYLQLFGNTISQWLKPHGHWNHIAVTYSLCYLLGAGAVLTTCTGHPEFSLLDGYLLLTMGNGIAITIFPGAPWMHNFMGMRDPLWLTAIKHFGASFWGFISLFFWWILLPGMEKRAKDCSGEILGWLFVPLEITVWLRDFHRVLGVVQWIFWLLSSLPYHMIVVTLGLSLCRHEPRGNSTGQQAPKSNWRRFIHYFQEKTGMMYDITFGSPGTSRLPPVETPPWRTGDSYFKRFLHHLSQDFRLVAGRYSYYEHKYVRGYEHGSSALLQVRATDLNRHTFKYLWNYPHSVYMLAKKYLDRLGIDTTLLAHACSLNILLATVLITEVSLALNGVTGLHSNISPGQLMALVIGLSGFLLTLIVSASTPGSNDEIIPLLNTTADEAYGTLESHSNDITSAAFSADSSMFASGPWDETVQLLNPTIDEAYGTLEGDDEAYVTFTGDSHFITSVAFSADGKVLVSGLNDKTIRFWDPATGETRAILEGHSDNVASVAFSPDGKMLASGSLDRTVRLWDPSTGEARGVLEGHSDNVASVAFSPDGKMLASGSLDRTVRLWDPSTGVALGVLEGHSDNVASVAFSPDSPMPAWPSQDHQQHTGLRRRQTATGNT